MSNYPIIEDIDLGRVSASVTDTTDCGLLTDSVDVTYDLGGDINSYLYTQYPAPLFGDLVFSSIGRIATTVIEYNSNYNTIKIAKYPNMVFTRNDSKYQVWYAPIQRYIQPITFTIVPTPENASVLLEAEGFVQEGTSITVDSGTVVEYTVVCEGYATVSGTYTVTERTVLPVTLTRTAFTLTIVPTPSDATVTFDTGTVSGNTTSVDYNTDVTYTVSRTGYITTSSIVNVKEDKSVSVSLSKDNYTLSISPTPSDATVTLTAAGYTQVGNSITVPYETEVQWTVSKNHYITRSGSQVVTTNNTIPVQLTEMPSLTIVPTPSDATVTLTAAGYTQEGNSIWVPANTEVAYSVDKRYYNSESGNVTLSQTQSINVTLTSNYYVPTVNEYIVNLSGATKSDTNVGYIPGRYRVTVQAGSARTKLAEGYGYTNVGHGGKVYQDITVEEPFVVRAYCGSKSAGTLNVDGQIGRNPYSGQYKINGVWAKQNIPYANTIFGNAGSSGLYSNNLTSSSSGNCLGDGAKDTAAGGSCLHLMPIGGTFGSNYLFAFHTTGGVSGALAVGGSGGAYGGGGAGSSVQGTAYAGGSTPYGNGGAANQSGNNGTGIGHGKKPSGSPYPAADGAAAWFNGTEWLQSDAVAASYTDGVISIQYLGDI